MPQQAPLQPGDPRRVGRYRLAGRITGLPADGPVFLGSSPDGAEVTISVLRSDWTSDAAGRDRFAAEAAVAKRVPPFCAARILDAGLDGGDAYLVSEYVHGRSLLEIISASGVLPEADLGPVAIGMATGLASVHQAGLVHGNFGPEYAIMTSSGPRVVEFGITPPYGSATPSADMLAWGQTVMFAAAGRPATTRADLDVLPGYLRGLVLDCLSPDPFARPSARTVVVALIGPENVKAGVLAEGSHRSVPGSGFRPPPVRPGTPYELRAPERGPAGAAAGPGAGYAPPQYAGGPDRAPVHPAAPGRAPQRGGGQRGGGQHGGGQRSSSQHGGPQQAHGTGPRPASRHSRSAADGPAAPTRAAPPQPGEARRGRPSLRAGVLAAVAVVAIAVLVVVGLRTLGHHGQPQAGNTSTQRVTARTPATSAPASPTAPGSPAATVTTPAEFAGAWSGAVQQPPNDTYDVALTLHNGSPAGRVRYQTAGVAAFSCALSLTSASHQKLTFTEAGQGNCTAGTVTLKRTGSAVSYTFRGGGFVATGSLTRG